MDINCLSTITDAIYDSTNCVADTVDNGSDKLGSEGRQDWSNTESDALHDYCIEKWNIATVVSASSTTWAERCMKISIKGARPF